MIREDSQPAIAFVGRQDSGKTTLVEKVIAQLVRRGYDVGSVKHHGHPGFQVDQEGKDSWRHAQAGSREVAIASPDRFALIRDTDQPMELDQVLASMASHDIIIVEGFRSGGLPTVELFRAANPNDQSRTLADSQQEVVAVATDRPDILQEAAAAGLPAFDLDDAASIVDFLEGYFSLKRGK